MHLRTQLQGTGEDLACQSFLLFCSLLLVHKDNCWVHKAKGKQLFRKQGKLKVPISWRKNEHEEFHIMYNGGEGSARAHKLILCNQWEILLNSLGSLLGSGWPDKATHMQQPRLWASYSAPTCACRGTCSKWGLLVTAWSSAGSGIMHRLQSEPSNMSCKFHYNIIESALKMPLKKFSKARKESRYVSFSHRWVNLGFQSTI